MVAAYCDPDIALEIHKRRKVKSGKINTGKFQNVHDIWLYCKGWKIVYFAIVKSYGFVNHHLRSPQGFKN